MATTFILRPCAASYLKLKPRLTTVTTRRPKSPIICSATDVSLFEAAKHTVDTYVKSGMVIGLGSGAASSLAIQYLGLQFRVGSLKDIVGIPTSVGSASEAAKAGVPLDQSQSISQIDFAFNDADVVEEGTLAAIIGRQKKLGEESIIEEKKVLEAAKNLVFMITGKQYKSGVQGSIPVLVESLNWMSSAEEIDDLFIGDAEVWRRPSIGHTGPSGGDFPLVTREGHNVLDVIFTSPILNLAEVGELLNKVVGVACHGIISKTPCTAVIATESGLRVIQNTAESEMRGV